MVIKMNDIGMKGYLLDKEKNKIFSATIVKS
jgi:hypothetical protein